MIFVVVALFLCGTPLMAEQVLWETTFEPSATDAMREAAVQKAFRDWKHQTHQLSEKCENDGGYLETPEAASLSCFQFTRDWTCWFWLDQASAPFPAACLEKAPH